MYINIDKGMTLAKDTGFRFFSYISLPSLFRPKIIVEAFHCLALGFSQGPRCCTIIRGPNWFCTSVKISG